jgi:hypothetical protein
MALRATIASSLALIGVAGDAHRLRSDRIADPLDPGDGL